MITYILPATIGSAIGPVQTAILRNEVDIPLANDFLTNKTTEKPLLVKQLKGFGTPSSLIGIISGAIGLGMGVYSAHTGKIFKTFNSQIAALTYGAGALLSGIMSGIYPTEAVENVIAKDPSNPIYTETSTLRKPLVITPSTVELPTREEASPPTPNQEVLAQF